MITLLRKIFHLPVRLKVTVDQGPKKNPTLTIVFLHGIAATSATWKGLLRQIHREPSFQNVRLVALDLLGFGKSSHSSRLDYNYQEYNEALDATFKQLKIHGPVIIVGHSMGSLIAAEYATEYEPAIEIVKLILISPPVLLAAELARLPDKAYARTYHSLHQFAKDVPAAEVIAKIIQKFSNFRSSYLKTPAFQKSMENIILNRQNYQTFTKLKTPTLLLHGHFDPLVMGSNLRRIAKRNPRNVRYQSVIGHHDISTSKRARVISEIKRTIKEVND